MTSMTAGYVEMLDVGAHWAAIQLRCWFQHDTVL